MGRPCSLSLEYSSSTSSLATPTLCNHLHLSSSDNGRCPSSDPRALWCLPLGELITLCCYYPFNLLSPQYTISSMNSGRMLSEVRKRKGKEKCQYITSYTESSCCTFKPMISLRINILHGSLIETREPTGSVRLSEIIRQSRKTDTALHKEYLSRYHTCSRIE